MNAATTLDTLDNDRCYIAFLEFCLYGCDVIKIKESHGVTLVEWRLDLGIIGHGYRTAGATMETAMESYHTALARMERSQLEGVLIALRA
jgi:hypothetical protein